MFADAIRDMEERLRRDDGERRRRAALRAPLRQAEVHAHRLEELLLQGRHRVPDDLAEEIRLFVQQQCPGTAPSGRSSLWTSAAPLLDLLFDLQERFQSRRQSVAAVPVRGAA